MADFSVTMSNGSAEADAAAAIFIVDIENAKRVVRNTEAGLESGDEGFEDPLPKTPLANLKASYEHCLSLILDKAHLSYQVQSAKKKEEEQALRQLWINATDAQRSAAIASLQA